MLSSEALGRAGDGRRVRVAGMVVARQRPATAKGVVFMLLEDEHGTINLIVPPPVAERCRWAVRSSGFVQAWGGLEHREGTTNVVVVADREARAWRHGRAAAACDRAGADARDGPQERAGVGGRRGGHGGALPPRGCPRRRGRRARGRAAGSTQLRQARALKAPPG